MEKKVYDLTINEALEHVMPPLQEIEIEKLTQKLIKEGCCDALVVWHGVIVDGHNRYRICHEHNIPFKYVEREFEDEADAKRWIIDNQVGRRNLSDYAKCELVLPLEAALKAEAKKRQGERNDLKNIPQNSAGSSKPKETREVMADMAGVSRDTLAKAKRIMAEADEDTKERLRRGEVTIHAVSEALKDKAQQPEQRTAEEQKDMESDDSGFDIQEIPTDQSLNPRLSSTGLEPNPERPPMRSDILPGYGLIKDLPPMEEGAYVRPPDSVYDIPPVEVYGNMPADDMKLRGNAELAHAKSEMTGLIDYCVRRTSEILRGMSAASMRLCAS